MAIEDLFEDLVIISEVTKTIDAFGSYTESTSPKLFGVTSGLGYLTTSGLECCIWGLTGDEIDEYEKKNVEADYGCIFLPQSGLTVKEMDQMTQVSRLSKEFDIVWCDELVARTKYVHLGLLEKKSGD